MLNHQIMKQIAVTIPDDKEHLFLEMMQSISFVQNIEEIETTDIPEWHTHVIDRRVENYHLNPESYRDWETIQQEIKHKYGV